MDILLSKFSMMGQQVWDMDSITGDHYTLGLYHGENSGNVVIYLNSRIFLIDFKIPDHKDYHFYVGQEFMRLSIQKKNDGFEYDLQVDRDAPTPLNNAIRESEHSEERLLLAGLIIASLLLLALFIYNYHVRYRF